MTSKLLKLKWNHEPQTSGFTAKFSTFWLHFYGRQEYRPWKIVVDLFFTTAFTVAPITSLPLSVLLSTMALDQSAREKSLGYCKIWLGIKRYHLYQKYHHDSMSLILSFFPLLHRRTAHDNSVVRGKEWGRTKLWHRRAPWSDRKNPGWVVESNVRMIKIALTG